MPSREEVERWLKEAGCLGVETDLWNNRAAQVEAMRCESCAKFSADRGNYCCLHDTFMESNEGCFSHEPKEMK